MPYPYQEGTTLSRAILTTIRTHRQLKGSLLLTALEMAHRASSSGFVRISYGYLASKTHQSIRTMIRHVHRLEALGILVKQRVWISVNRCAVNVYAFCLRPLHRCASVIVSRTLPQKEERDKVLSLWDEIQLAERGLRFVTPGTIAYQSAWDNLQRLRGLLPPP